MKFVSNTHSYFWRHAEQFEELTQLLSRAPEPIRIWSAGCAHGEEAYSLAFLLDHLKRDGSVLASDILPSAIEAGRKGEYRLSKLEQLPLEFRDKFILKADGTYSVPDQIKSRVSFQQDDLLNSRVEGLFDLIICRNVMIYFESGQVETTLNSLCQRLNPSGHLLLGYAESSMLSHPSLQRLNVHALFQLRPLPSTTPVVVAPLLDTSFRDAMAAYSLGEIRKADLLFEKNLELQPSSLIGLYFKALVEIEQRRSSNIGEQLLKKLEDSSPLDPQTQTYLNRHNLSPNIFKSAVRRVLKKLETTRA